MGYTVWVEVTRPRPLDGGEYDRLMAHLARHQRADWPESYRLRLALGQPDPGLALTGRMKVGHDTVLIERLLVVLTELRGLFEGATCLVLDDLKLVAWNGTAYELGAGPGPRSADEQRPAPPAVDQNAPTPAADPDPATPGAQVDHPSEKVALTKVQRVNGLMYYVKTGGVWAVRRKRPGEPKGEAVLVAAAEFEMDHSRYLYWVDGDGDIARKLRTS